MTNALHWLAQNVAAFDVVVGDYFHRHNLEEFDGFEPAVALAAAIENGARHVNRVRRILINLNLFAVRVKLATEVCRQSSFASSLHEMRSAYQTNSRFAELIEQGTDIFLTRVAREKVGSETARSHSRAYQLEELAMFAVLATQGYQTIAYVGAHLPVMKALVGGELRGFPSALTNTILVGLYKGKEK